MLEVWQNFAPFGGRQIVGNVEELLTKFVNQQLSLSPNGVFFIAATVSRTKQH
jgi:hypothetical protein